MSDSPYAPVINVDEPPRGGTPQGAAAFAAKSIRSTFSWGSTPATAQVTYVGTSPVQPGAAVNIGVAGHLFVGLCLSDVAAEGGRGLLRTMEFRDLREYLGWDFVYCAFNKLDVRIVNGVRTKRYWHIFPADFDLLLKTYTSYPLLGYEILNEIMLSGSVGSPWNWDLTSAGEFPGGVMNQPVYDVDCLNGKRLDAVLNELSEKQGVVFTHKPLGTANDAQRYHLVWTRKGVGSVSVPSNSDQQRSGLALSGHPTNVRVLGGRNRYQVLNVGMQADWAVGWEQFLVFDDFIWDIYANEKDPTSDVAYTEYANDDEHWVGYGDAKVRAMELTVTEYVALKEARVGGSGTGTPFIDRRKFAGRSRMDMPCALYIETILRRAFRPTITSIQRADGVAIPLDAVEISDSMVCKVTLNYATGVMTHDPATPVDGTGIFAVKGYQAGEDLFRMADPATIDANFFSAANRTWGAVPFSIDDGGDGGRFIIAENPVFVSSSVSGEELLVDAGGAPMLNAAFKLVTPTAKATLTFEAERFSHTRSGVIDVSRDAVENVADLNAEYSGNSAADYVEIPYGDGDYSVTKAIEIADVLLDRQYYYSAGGYDLKWKPDTALTGFSTPLSSMVDRVQIQVGPGGVNELVDFAAERQRDSFESERELDRRTQQNSLFPGQSELRKGTEDQKRLNAGIRQMQRTNAMQLFQQFLRGGQDRPLTLVWIEVGTGTLPAGTLPAGTRADSTRAVAPTDSTDTDTFLGVTVRHNELASRPLHVQNSGVAWCRVQGPLAQNETVGVSPGHDYLEAGSKNPVGRAMKGIDDSSTKIVPVLLGGAPGAGMHPFKIYRAPASDPPTAEDWRKVIVRAGLYGHLAVSTGTDGVTDPDGTERPTTTPVTVPAATAKYFFWIEYDGAGGVQVKHSAAPASSTWTGYPSMDENHVPIGFVDTQTYAADERLFIRQIVRADILLCHI